MLKALAAQGIYFGTSSWKYEGWLGSIYTPERYTTRGKFSRRKFEDECLAEYAETFPAVGGDFSFYQFPAPEYWQRLFDGVAAIAALRPQGAGGDHRCRTGRAMPGTAPAGQGQHVVSRSPALRGRIRAAAANLTAIALRR